MGERETNPANGSAMRCLLLATRGRDVPPELTSGLQQRGVTTDTTFDLPAVMVRLARQRFGTLVILDPPAWPQLDALAAAVRRYHPGVALWQYRFDADPRLERYAAESDAATDRRSDAGAELPERAADAATAESSPPSSPARNAKHETRNDPAPIPSVAPSLPRSKPSPSPDPDEDDLGFDPGIRLTEEELAMLLDDDEPAT